MTASCARSESAVTLKVPDTPASRVFREWLLAYNAADSTRLEEYVRQHEPAMSVHTQLVLRAQTGPLDLASVARSEQGHLEVVLRSRADSTVGFTPLTLYGVAGLESGSTRRATTSITLAGTGAWRSLPSISAAARATAIDSVIAKVVRNYVFLDVAHEVADSLRARRSRGAYDAYEAEISFAQRLNHDLRELGRDRQLGIEYAWRVPVQFSAPIPPAMLHCGLDEPRMFGDSTGYLRFYGFADPTIDCGQQLSKAMTAVAGSRALILDLRESMGGYPDYREAIAYLASYVVSGCTHLDDIQDRRTGLTEMLWTHEGLPGSAFGGSRPLYILTSSRTFAAAEELAYSLQSLGRAVIVGEPTGGGAHVTAVGQVGAHLFVQVPIARAINPITHTNWRAFGVMPDVRVPEGDALATARRLIGEQRAGVPRTMMSLANSARRDLSLDMRSASSARAAATDGEPLRGIRFAVDTLVSSPSLRVMLARVAGTVEFAQGRGRLDVTAVSHAPAVAVNGVTIAEPLARPGDYYLFDNTGFVLVRPSVRTFSRVAFTRADFNHTGNLLPGASMSAGRPITRLDTLATSDLEARRQHARAGIWWHMEPRAGPPPSGGDWHMFGRGWVEIADAPAVEVGVARWFEVAASLATRDDGLRAVLASDLQVTLVAFLYQPGATAPSVQHAEVLAPERLTEVDVDRRRLVVPAGYAETRWPGFERAPGPLALSQADAERWRTLEDTASQRARSACRQAWLPDGASGFSADRRLAR